MKKIYIYIWSLERNCLQGRKLEKHHWYYKRELACSTRSQELNTRPKVRSFREVGLGSKWRWSYWEQSKCCLRREWIPFLKFKQFIATSKRQKMNIIMSRMFPCSLPTTPHSHFNTHTFFRFQPKYHFLRDVFPDPTDSERLLYFYYIIFLRHSTY